LESLQDIAQTPMVAVLPVGLAVGWKQRSTTSHTTIIGGNVFGKKKKLPEAAVESTHTAAERGTAALEDAIERVKPWAHVAAEKAAEAKDKAAPLAAAARGSAKDHIGPYADQAREKAAPYADQAREMAAPYANQARERSADLADKADKARSNIEPMVHDYLEQAHDFWEDEVLPKLNELLSEAQDDPRVVEVSKRSQATLAALKGDLEVANPKTLELAEPKKRGFFRTAAKLIAMGAVLAGAAVAVRQFLGSKDEGWTAHQPSTAYTPANEAPNPASAPVTEPQDAPGAEDAAEPDDEAAAEATMAAEGGHPEYVHEETTAETPDSYGEGSYIGDEPPEGFEIKGNERSMKYHTSENGGYERTIADVWFNSPEAAEAAGFTHAQR